MTRYTCETLPLYPLSEAKIDVIRWYNLITPSFCHTFLFCLVRIFPAGKRVQREMTCERAASNDYSVSFPLAPEERSEYTEFLSIGLGFIRGFIQ